jgi:preprotein translocase subunit SecD
VKRGQIVSLVGIVVLAIAALVGTLVSGNRPQLGLDLRGGASVVLQPVDSVSDEVLDQTISIIRDRVDALGVAEPEISRQGGNILVELPGVRDQDRALEIVGRTAQLTFRPVLELLPADASLGVPVPSTVPTIQGPTTLPPVDTTVEGEPTETTATETTATETTATETTATETTATETTAAPDGGPGNAVSPTTTTAAAAPATDDATTTTVASDPVPETTVPVPTTIIATTDVLEDDPTVEQVLPQLDDDGNVIARYRVGPSRLSGTAVETAASSFTTQWEVVVTFRDGDNGIDGWNAIAADCRIFSPTCPTNQVAVVLDGNVISAPTFNESTFDNDVLITGQFDEREADDLALILRYGSLPVELEPQAVQTVSATLGQDSLRAGVIAGIVGIALVLLFLLAYYRWLALVVVLGLCISGALMFSFISLLGETRGLALTLAGATGIIVSIGVTVDSYVVYFERLKDDVRAGRSLRVSADRGFKGAWRTIVAADLVSLIGAFLLWWLSVGSVRGFAFFLGISTILDMIVAWFFTRPMVALLTRRMGKSDHVLGVAKGEAITPAESLSSEVVGAR